MSKIKWIITLSICAALAFSLFIFFNKANFTEASENKETGLFFARNYISYMMEDETMSFNIFGLQKANAGVPLSGETVTSLAFDNNHIQISDYKVETGIRHKGYTLVNIIVDVRVSSDKPEKADQLLISFNGRVEKHFKSERSPFKTITMFEAAICRLPVNILQDIQNRPWTFG
ncbi:hypothetical protein [Bacillus haynesii]|uniref:hypothetical protein n=1 Tax=Bacillus haynesii TaxID=1925021 RepID=UPI001EFB18C4|nr:hypothetical protein [Bacillus haynesii]MCI4128896.1 hypothetical protein [Bacillus haynesii]